MRETTAMVAGPGLRWRVRARRAMVTLALIATCLTVFTWTVARCAMSSAAWPMVLLDALYSGGTCRDTLISAGALELGRVWVDDEWWRVGTTGLLHASWLHVILNIWSLWVVGEWAEATWGHVRVAVLFASSSVVGCLASVAWAEAPMVVGASAGVLGIAGALLVGRLAGTGRVAERLRPISARGLGGTLAVLLGIGFVVPVIAQAGHIGGLVIGMLVGLLWSGVRWRREGALVGWVVVGLLGVGVGWAARAPAWRGGYQEYRGFRLLEVGRSGEAIAAFEEALADRPGDAVLANAVAYGLAEAGRELDRAKALVGIALAVEPDNPDYLDTLGWIHCRGGDAKTGLELLRRAEEAFAVPVGEVEEHLETCADAAVPRGT